MLNVKMCGLSYLFVLVLDEAGSKSCVYAFRLTGMQWDVLRE